MNWNSTAIQITVDEIEPGEFLCRLSLVTWLLGQRDNGRRAIRDYVEALPGWVAVGGRMWVRREDL
jgi:hypothetical protein